MIPFKFGVMFGDIGHGLILFFIGIYLCCKKSKVQEQFSYGENKNIKERLLDYLLYYRYIIVLMGFFSFYCGLIYNEFFSIPLHLFGTCFEKNSNPNIQALVYKTNCSTVIGIDY